MPIIDDQINPGLMSLVLQQGSQAHEQRLSQIRNLLTTAHAGQTVAELGITPKRFAEMFGKDVPYDPNKQIVDEKSTDVMDKNVKRWIAGLTPDQAMDLAASQVQNKSGVAGMTTSKGVKDQMTAGGIKDTTALDIATKTAPDVVTAGISNAAASAKNAQAGDVQAGTHLDVMKEVATRTNAGIESMRQQPVAVQTLLNQKLAMGSTANELMSSDMENQLKIATIKEALQAQVNPNHPLNAFLAKNDLDIHTAMGGAAMGLTSLMDTYARAIATTKVNDKDAANILLRMKAEYAKDISERVLKGKATPNQVMTIMDDMDNGRPPRKGYEGLAALMAQATEASYQAAVTDALEKGDPIARGAAQAVSNMAKLGKDPRQLEAANQISRLQTAHLMTVRQFGSDKPDEKADPEGAKKWAAIYDANLKRIIGAKVEVHWYGNDYGATGGPTDIGGQVPNKPVLPVTPISGVPAIKGMMGGADGTQPGSAGPATIPANPANVTPEQKAAIDAWYQAFNASQAAPAAKP